MRYIKREANYASPEYFELVKAVQIALDIPDEVAQVKQSIVPDYTVV
jgi:hypothetical protein